MWIAIAIILISVSASALQVFQDDWEDGAYTNNPAWQKFGVETVQVQAVTFHNGAKALQCTSNSGGPGHEAYVSTKVQNEAIGEDYNTWINVSDVTKTYLYELIDASSNIVAGIGISGSKFQYISSLNTFSNFTEVPVNDTWYLLAIDHNKNTNVASYRLYDTSGNLLEAQLNKSTGNLADANQITMGTFINDAAASSFWDNTSYGPTLGLNAVEFTILIPKDEKNFNNITPYSLRLTDGSAQEFQMLTTDKNVFWFRNNAKINIDVNANGYFTRRYSFDSNTDETSLQPYLVSNLVGVQKAIKVIDATSLAGIQNISLQSIKTINDVDVNIENRITDSAGIAEFSFYLGDSYKIRVVQNGVEITTFTLTPIDTGTITVILPSTIVVPTVPMVQGLDLNWQPPNFSACILDNNSIDFNQSINFHGLFGATISSMDINVSVNDKNIYSDHNTSFANIGVLYEDLNLNRLDYNLGQKIEINLMFHLSDGNNVSFTRTYDAYFCNGCSWIPGQAFTSRNYYACVQQNRTLLTIGIPGLINAGTNLKAFTTLIALVLSLIITLGITTKASFDLQGAGFVFLFIFGFFGIINWVDWYVIALCALGTIAVWLSWRNG